ncbi:MAG: hypothetical protein ACLVLA_01055 [Acidaminococcus intestini]|uniref:hypothetical protein n=1 Tax=Acidaminococcus intestini TaxID=187327 RepID=UPI00307AD2E9
MTDCIVSEFAPIDASCAAENLWLKTAELGLGGTLMGVYPRRERALAVKNSLAFLLRKRPLPFLLWGTLKRRGAPKTVGILNGSMKEGKFSS